MNVYRHKQYDFDKGLMPLGVEWKEPEVYSETLPDSDYELYSNHDEEILLLKDIYKTRIADGEDYNLESTAEGYFLLIHGAVTLAELETYGADTEHVGVYLAKGYWHSAYLELLDYVPSATMASYHASSLATIKDYVNTNYESYFHIA